MELVSILNAFSQDYQQNWCSWEKALSVSIFYFNTLTGESSEKSKPLLTHKGGQNKRFVFSWLPVFSSLFSTQRKNSDNLSGTHCFLWINSLQLVSVTFHAQIYKMSMQNNRCSGVVHPMLQKKSFSFFFFFLILFISQPLYDGCH